MSVSLSSRVRPHCNDPWAPAYDARAFRHPMVLNVLLPSRAQSHAWPVPLITVPSMFRPPSDTTFYCLGLKLLPLSSTPRPLLSCLRLVLPM